MDENLKNKVLVCLAKNISVKDINLELNVSMTTIYRWKKRYESEIKLIQKSIEVKTLIKQERYIEALEICEKPEFLGDETIQSQRRTILKNYNIDDFSIFNNIKNGIISLEDINNGYTNSLKKIIITVAFYEIKKYPQKTVLRYLKACIKEYENNNKALGILNSLKNRMLQKNVIFDTEFYCQLLYCEIEAEREQLLAAENLIVCKETDNSLRV